jgi:aminoglycoside phosphotransferase (APT) family kinase protein
VHGDAKPGNFAFVDDGVSAVFDWEMATLGDPLTDIGWLDELLARYTGSSGIAPANREWYRALHTRWPSCA